MSTGPELTPKSSHKAGSAEVAGLPHGFPFRVLCTDMQSGGKCVVERAGSHPKAASLFPPLGLARNSSRLGGSRCAFFVSLRVWERKGGNRKQGASAAPSQAVPTQSLLWRHTHFNCCTSKGNSLISSFFFRALARCLGETKKKYPF